MIVTFHLDTLHTINRFIHRQIQDKVFMAKHLYLWISLTAFSKNVLETNFFLRNIEASPWLTAEDVNELSNPNEKLFAYKKIPLRFTKFNKFLNNGLADLSHLGFPFAWYNKTEAHCYLP